MYCFKTMNGKLLSIGVGVGVCKVSRKRCLCWEGWHWVVGGVSCCKILLSFVHFTSSVCQLKIISAPNIHFCLAKRANVRRKWIVRGGEVGGESVGQNAGKASARGVTTPILWVSILCIVCIVCRWCHCNISCMPQAMHGVTLDQWACTQALNCLGSLGTFMGTPKVWSTCPTKVWMQTSSACKFSIWDPYNGSLTAGQHLSLITSSCIAIKIPANATSVITHCPSKETYDETQAEEPATDGRKERSRAAESCCCCRPSERQQQQQQQQWRVSPGWSMASSWVWAEIVTWESQPFLPLV